MGFTKSLTAHVWVNIICYYHHFGYLDLCPPKIVVVKITSLMLLTLKAAGSFKFQFLTIHTFVLQTLQQKVFSDSPRTALGSVKKKIQLSVSCDSG